MDERTIETLAVILLFAFFFAVIGHKDRADSLRSYRADWLRSEIEKLEGMKKPEPPTTATFPRNEKYTVIGHNQALTSIITRYKEELSELEKGV